MANMTVHWRHTAFSRDAGIPKSENEEGKYLDSVRTGVLTDEHQAAVDDRPVLVEDATGRVYRSNDLPPNTEVFVVGVSNPPQPIFENARRAGFQVTAQPVGNRQ